MTFVKVQTYKHMELHLLTSNARDGQDDTYTT